MQQDIIEGFSLTKEKRQELFGNVAGGSSSCNPEKYQRNTIVKYTGIECKKTNIRINLRTKELISKAHPNVNRNGFDYSEDFDGVQMIEHNTIYINLKCIVGKGGVQTRSLREVYWFVEGQLQTLKKNKKYIFRKYIRR